MVTFSPAELSSCSPQESNLEAVFTNTVPDDSPADVSVPGLDSRSQILWMEGNVYGGTTPSAPNTALPCLSKGTSVPLYRLTIGNVAWVTNRLVNSTFPCQSMLYQKCPAEAQRGRLAFWTISYPRRKYSSSSSDLPVVGSLVRHRSSTPAPNVTDSFIEMQQSSRAGRTTRGTLHIPHHRARAKECRLRRRMRFGVFSMGRYGIGAFPFSTCTSMTLMLATMRTTPPSGQRPKMARGRSRRKLALN